MAQKRMFDKAIIETDQFLNISLSAKALYFLLGMECDDEGFVSPTRVLRLYGGESGDIKNLMDVGLVIRFKSGVLVITDFNQNNYLDKNRIKPTQHQEERKQLSLTNNGKYMFNNCLTSVKPEECSIEEYRVEEKRREKTRSVAFAPPSLSEVQEYCKERNNGIEASNFIDFYSSNGWMVGKNKMKDWRACVRTWEGRNNKETTNSIYSVLKINTKNREKSIL